MISFANEKKSNFREQVTVGIHNCDVKFKNIGLKKKEKANGKEMKKF